MRSRKKIKVLYLAPYSAKAYGAEEQDIESGWKLLQSMKNIEAHYVKINLQQKNIVSNLSKMEFQSQLGIRDKCSYLINLLSTPDNAMRQAYSYANFRFITRLIIDLRIDVIFTNTTSTVLFGNQSRAKHVFRSVSFEPVYVLKSVNNYFLARIHSLLKVLSVFQELRADNILAISPRDADYYKASSMFRSTNKISIISLRQLAYREVSKKNSSKGNFLNVGFMGSTYNVLHNKKSFNFIYEKLNFNKLNAHNIVVNVYGRKIPNQTADKVHVRIHNYVGDINLIYKNNHVFIVPFFLSSGMQSKVFEPLLYGKILVCDPRVLAGYNFEPFVHYIPATSPEDFMSALIWIKKNTNKGSLIGENARLYSSQLFNKRVFKDRLNLALNLHTHS